MIPINKRSIGSCIILSLITFRIYSIYWEYLLVKNTRAIKKDDSSCTGEMLCLIFVPFYSLYWWFTRGKLVRDEFSKHRYSASSNETVFLVLALFGLGIVAMAIMQNDFNSLPSESTQSVQRSATNPLRIALIYLSPVVIGSILYQSIALSLVYNSKGSFSASIVYFLTTRGIQFAITLVIDTLLTWLLFRTRLFEHTGLWQTPKEETKRNDPS